MPGRAHITLPLWCKTADACSAWSSREGMQCSPQGHIAAECWRLIPTHFPSVELGAFVVMPNHLHGVLILHDRAAIASPHVGAPVGPHVGAQHAAPLPSTMHPPSSAPLPPTMPRPQSVPPPSSTPLPSTMPLPRPTPLLTPSRPHVEPGSLAAIIRSYKAAVTRKIIQEFGGIPCIWQRNYYEHIIRTMTNEPDHQIY